MRAMLCLAHMVAALPLLAQPSAPAVGARDTGVAARIARVESGLLTPMAMAGAPETRYTIAQRMQHYHVPGVSIAVINGGRIEWARGYGVREFGGTTPVDTSTIFQAGSISKPVAATAALRLVEQHKLDLDADINSELHSWKVPSNEFTKSKPVTLRAILTHSGGLTVHGFPGYDVDAPVPTVVQVLDGTKPANTAAVRVDVAPGSIWRYSGGGITIAQLAMTDVTGRTFPDLMRELVLAPAGMTHSTYENPLPASFARFAASGHEKLDTPVHGKYHTYPEMAAAGLWTTASDLARWAIEMQRAYSGQSTRLLSQAMAKQMLSRQFGQWGLGVAVSGAGDTATFGHGGRDEGFVAQVTATIEGGRGFVILTNGVSGALLEEIGRSIGDAYGWPSSPRRTMTRGTIEPSTLRDLVGRYRYAVAPDTLIAAVSLDDGALYLQMPGEPREELIPSSGLAFVTPVGLRISFVRAGSGPASEMLLGGQPLRLARIGE
ncbi:MAG: beta-lactamase family protein [Gemmatimonadota bacterium]|nr:beta-lactamase family protein [Gemmatimonadota bacterium]